MIEISYFSHQPRFCCQTEPDLALRKFSLAFFHSSVEFFATQFRLMHWSISVFSVTELIYNIGMYMIVFLIIKIKAMTNFIKVFHNFGK
jgi:hypothetical protein